MFKIIDIFNDELIIEKQGKSKLLFSSLGIFYVTNEQDVEKLKHHLNSPLMFEYCTDTLCFERDSSGELSINDNGLTDFDILLKECGSKKLIEWVNENV